MRQLFAGILCGVTAVAMAAPLHAQSLGIGAGTQGSQNYAVNAGTAKFLSDKTGLDIRVQAYGGSGQTMPLIDSGRLDLQLIPSPDIQAAVAGEGPFEGRPLQNLRLLGSLNSSAYGFMVRADSDYTEVSEISGLAITYGYSAQPTLALQVDALLAAGGLSMDDMQPVMVPSVPNGVDEFISGNADVAFFALQGGKTREADAAVGIRWLAVENTPEANEAIKEFVPTGYVKVVEPGPNAIGVSETTPMLGYDYMLVAGAHVPDDVVKTVISAIHDDPEGVREIGAAFAEFTPETMAPELDGLTYHPAAAAYYTATGLQ